MFLWRSILINEHCHVLLPASLQLLSEVLDGIKVYFDFTLFDHLLYGPEKEQHRALGMINPVFTKKQAASQNAPPAPLCDGLSGASGHETLYQCLPSQVYGFIHLLRLFVKLPDFLTRAQLPASHAHLLHLHCRDLLGWVRLLIGCPQSVITISVQVHVLQEARALPRNPLL